jgi:hypothetical protein
MPEIEGPRIEPCRVCGRSVRTPSGINATGDKAIIIYIGAQTTGFRPRVMSKKQRLPICITCSNSIATGRPPEGAFNESVYIILREIVKNDKRVHDAAWEEMQNPHAPLKLMPGSRADTTLQPPIVRGELLAG